MKKINHGIANYWIYDKGTLLEVFVKYDMTTTTEEVPAVKKSTKLLIAGVVMILTVVLAGELFDAIGVAFGLEQITLTAAAGVVGALKLLAGG